jgi:hypothetical protein
MARLDTLLVQCARSARNVIIDARYGGLLCVNIRTWRKHGLFYVQNSDYGALARIFKNRIRASDEAPLKMSFKRWQRLVQG